MTTIGSEATTPDTEKSCSISIEAAQCYSSSIITRSRSFPIPRTSSQGSTHSLKSLVAFLLSEIVRQSVKFFVVVFSLHPPVLTQHLMGLFNVVPVTLLLWQYQSHWRDKLSILIPPAGR
jgi:hypothetical protein